MVRVPPEKTVEDAPVELVAKLTRRSWTVAVAESCTAGLAADLLARIPGASRALWGSFVCYTPGAKTVMLEIPEDYILRYGAVSGETALAMAEGALSKSGAHVAVAITGLAGPEGDGGPEPVGAVYIATALRGEKAEFTRFQFSGSRNEIRAVAALAALEELLKRLP